MDFSIVIPIYNSARYLPKTLKRIFNACQGFDYQVIWLMIALTDDIKSIRQIAATNSNVMLQRKTEEQCGGIAQLRHQVSAIRIVFFLDSDDYLRQLYYSPHEE
ncbi:glycosyltransferase family 2 protein [Serratia ureilytica]